MSKLALAILQWRRVRLIHAVAGAVGVLALASCGSITQTIAANDLVIEQVTVISPHLAEPIANTDVAIKNGLIVAIGQEYAGKSSVATSKWPRKVPDSRPHRLACACGKPRGFRPRHGGSRNLQLVAAYREQLPEAISLWIYLADRFEYRASATSRIRRGTAAPAPFYLYQCRQRSRRLRRRGA